MKTTLIGITAALAAPSTAAAHAGHVIGATMDRGHYLTDPYHLLLGVAVAVCVGTILWVTTRALSH